MPIAEFLSTSHNQTCITKYLTSIKSFINVFSSETMLPEIIVTDISWALINSALHVFNNTNLSNYIQWCYDIIISKREQEILNIMKIRVYLCSTHFLKNIIKKVNRTNADKTSRRIFIFMFSLI